MKRKIIAEMVNYGLMTPTVDFCLGYKSNGTIQQIPLVELNKQIGFTFTPSLIVLNPELKLVIERDAKTHENGEGNQSLVRQYSRFINNPAVLDKVYIADAASVGLGLFSRQGFKRGDFVGEYTGVVVPRYKAAATNIYIYAYHPAGSSLKDYGALELDAKFVGGHIRFANDSKRPNVDGMFMSFDGLWRIIFVANRSIQPDEQLMIDYGTEYWEKYKKLEGITRLDF